MTGTGGRDDASRPPARPGTDGADETDSGIHQGDPHERPAHEGLPFGQDPQEQQGDDPGSGGS